MDDILPYSDFDRVFFKACRELVANHCGHPGPRIEVSERTPHPVVSELKRETQAEVVCERDGIDSFLSALRSVKDQSEVEYLRQACRITNEMLTALTSLIHERRKELTELDLALFIEKEARQRGGETVGFETLVACPQRSYAIHPFPAYTGCAFSGAGLSLLDFGVQYCGYTSDVTVPVIQHPLSKGQTALLETVLGAYDLALTGMRKRRTGRAIAESVEGLMRQAGYSMPHSLGHGIGLNAHEQPILSVKAQGQELRPGMVFTVEPGLYDASEGGIRLENDILVTENGYEVLTEAKPIVVPGH